MDPIVPEGQKRFGVSYAVTDTGLELPVIDVTHPAFAIAPTDAELDALAAAFQEMMGTEIGEDIRSLNWHGGQGLLP